MNGAYWKKNSRSSYEIRKDVTYAWATYPRRVGILRRVGDGWSWRLVGNKAQHLPELPVAEAKKSVEAILRLTGVL